MTDPSEVVVSDEDAIDILWHLNVRVEEATVHSAKLGLARIIAKRVPDAMPAQGLTHGDWDQEAHGFNACRAKVLRGEE
jgi:hypothetical protein